MKYNPKINEDVARMEGFSHIHPDKPESSVQGAMAMMYDLQQSLWKLQVWMKFLCNLLLERKANGQH